MPELYPLKFNPILKNKIWGGNKLNLRLGKNASDTCGESWEISDLNKNESIVNNGPLAGQSLAQLLRDFKGTLIGERNYQKFGDAFPLLIKFIDANADLSIQVHPAENQKPGQGKTEMWYVIEAEKGATLLSGFNADYSHSDLKTAIDKGSFDETMNRVPINAGDVFFIEANQVHTIGKGILLAEIQQPSDTTYRIYDFDRQDVQGNKRELHIDQAFEVMNMSRSTGKVLYDDGENVPLVECAEFRTNLLTIGGEFDLQTTDSFQILMNVHGIAELQSNGQKTSLNFGETCLVPSNTHVTIVCANQCKMLLTTVDP